MRRDPSHDELPRPRKRAKKLTVAQLSAQHQAQIQGLQEQLAGVTEALTTLSQAQSARQQMPPPSQLGIASQLPFQVPAPTQSPWELPPSSQIPPPSQQWELPPSSQLPTSQFPRPVLPRLPHAQPIHFSMVPAHGSQQQPPHGTQWFGQVQGAAQANAQRTWHAGQGLGGEGRQ